VILHLAHSSLELKARWRKGRFFPFVGAFGLIQRSKLSPPKRKACSRESMMRFRSERFNKVRSATTWTFPSCRSCRLPSAGLISPSTNSRPYPIFPKSFSHSSGLAPFAEEGKVMTNSEPSGKASRHFQTCSGLSGTTGFPHFRQ